MLWGALAMDYWEHTSTGQDSLNYSFVFVNPDTTDTLAISPGCVIFTSDVQCTVWSYGDSALWIDRAPQLIQPGEAAILGARIDEIRVGISGAGIQRAWAYAY
jgi:hypothetical protein